MSEIVIDDALAETIFSRLRSLDPDTYVGIPRSCDSCVVAQQLSELTPYDSWDVNGGPDGWCATPDISFLPDNVLAAGGPFDSVKLPLKLERLAQLFDALVPENEWQDYEEMSAESIWPLLDHIDQEVEHGTTGR